MESAYGAPLLRDDQLIQVYREFVGCPLEAQSLARPTPDFAQQLFQAIVIELTGATKEQLRQPVVSAMDVLGEHEVLFLETIPILHLWIKLREVMDASLVDDFSMEDIFRPDATRLRKQLSAVGNFLKFREERMAQIVECQVQKQKMDEEFAALELKEFELRRELEELEQQRAAEQPVVTDIKAEAAGHVTVVKQLAKQQKELASEIADITQKNNCLKDEQENIKFAQIDAQQARDRLIGQLVQSPEKMRRSLQEDQESMEKERLRGDELFKRVRGLDTRRNMIGRVEKDVQGGFEEMQLVLQERDAKKNASRDVKGLQRKIVSLEHEVGELEARGSHLAKKEERLQDKVSKQEKQRIAKREAAESLIRHEASVVQGAQGQHAALEQEMARHMRTQAEWTEKAGARRATCQEMEQELMRRHRQHRQNFQVYSMLMREVMAIEGEGEGN